MVKQKINVVHIQILSFYVHIQINKDKSRHIYKTQNTYINYYINPLKNLKTNFNLGRMEYKTL
jgi:predicted metal-dependent peptidase